MLNQYYLRELQNLRELGAEFSKAHPAIAPLLSGPSSDPAVERLLEGVAFLTGLLRRKLDDEYPEIIHGLMNILFPHYIRPIPSCSIVVFMPKPNLAQTVKVKKGTSLAAAPIEGTSCLFRTCFDVDVHPLRLTGAELLQQAGRNSAIQLTLELTGSSLAKWKPERLPFLLGGSSADSADLFMFLTHYLDRIVIQPEGGAPCELAPEALVPVGFDAQNNLLPQPSPSFSGYRLLQEYFVLPRKFVFFELQGWERWTGRGEGKKFQIRFELRAAPLAPPQVTPDHFILYGTPVVNLFTHSADPVVLDHQLDRLRVRPALQNRRHSQVYSVEQVIGHTQGSVARKEYVPLERFHDGEAGRPVYQISYGRSPIDNLSEVFLSFGQAAAGAPLQKETLSITMTCTNGELAEQLKVGEISVPTFDSPEMLAFRNILPPTPMIEPPLGENTPWRFLSHLALNYLNLADVKSVQELLRLYAFPEGRDRAAVAANLKRIEGILEFRVRTVDRLLRGMMLRGQELEMTCRQDYFAGLGGLFLFGAVMDLFFGVYASMNTFIQFRLKDSLSGEIFAWHARMGDRPLI